MVLDSADGEPARPLLEHAASNATPEPRATVKSDDLVKRILLLRSEGRPVRPDRPIAST